MTPTTIQLIYLHKTLVQQPLHGNHRNKYLHQKIHFFKLTGVHYTPLYISCINLNTVNNRFHFYKLSYFASLVN